MIISMRMSIVALQVFAKMTVIEPHKLQSWNKPMYKHINLQISLQRRCRT